MKQTHLWVNHLWMNNVKRIVLPTMIFLLVASGCAPIAAPAQPQSKNSTIPPTTTLSETVPAESGLAAGVIATSTMTMSVTPSLTETAITNIPSAVDGKDKITPLANADSAINQAYLQWLESTGVSAAEISPEIRASSPNITVTLLITDENAVSEVKTQLEHLNGTVLDEAGTTVVILLPIGELEALSAIPGILLIQTPSIAPPISVAPGQPMNFAAPAYTTTPSDMPNELQALFESQQNWTQEQVDAWLNSTPIDYSGLDEILAQKQNGFSLADSSVNLAYQKWQATVAAAGGDVATAASTSAAVNVTLVMNDLDAATAAKAWLPSIGATLIDEYQEWLVITLPVGQIKALMDLPGLMLAQQPAMQPPAQPFPTEPKANAQSSVPNVGEQGTIVTEGVVKSGINQWHAAGYTGEGVKIAVVDSFDQAIINSAYAQGELPTNVLNGPSVQGVDHGIAVAEIIYDMAPDATISLHSIGDAPDYCVAFANTLEGFAQAGNQIISSSTGPTFCTTPGNGASSPLTAAVERVVDQYDTFYAQAAGNNSQHHYEANFNGTNINVGNTTLNVHRFDGANTNVNVLSVPNSNGVFTPYPLEGGSVLLFYLRWDGGWPTSTQDYDMYLVYNTGDGWNFLGDVDCPQYACYSVIEQNGSAPAMERIETIVPYNAYYGIVITKYNANSNHYLDLLTGHAQPYLLNHVKSRSLVAAASYPAVYAVAAVDVGTLELEDYSSQGPTYGPGNSPNGGFDQPKLAGFANVSTSVSADFNGTSAATPHVAGAAAVLREASPCLTAREVGEWLQAQATDRGPSGYDHQFGAGVLTFPAASQRPSCGNQGPFPPQAVGNGYTTLMDTTVSGNLINNDSDPQNSPLTVATYTQPTNGTVTVNNNGSFTYNPDASFVGIDFFTYTIQNSHNLTNTAAVYVLVQNEGDEPGTVVVHTAGVPTTQAVSGQPYNLSLQLPGNLATGLSANEFLAIVHTPIITPTEDMTVTDGTFAGILFDLTGYVNGVQRNNVIFSAPLRMDIQYPALTVQGIDPKSLGMLYWNATSSNWESDGVSVASRAPQNRRLTVATNHLTQFGLFSLANPSEYSAIFMPVLGR